MSCLGGIRALPLSLSALTRCSKRNLNMSDTHLSYQPTYRVVFWGTCTLSHALSHNHQAAAQTLRKGRLN